MMKQLLEQAFEALGHMPIEAQDDIARALLGLAAPDTSDEIEPEHLDAVMEGMQQAERGAFAEGEADEIVAAAFRRHAQ